MLKLDHITVISPTLHEGVSHVRDCLDIDVPFGTRHTYMGTYNHRLQLGNSTYLEIVALDPNGVDPKTPRWFGLDNQNKVQADWDDGRRLRACVASSPELATVVANHGNIFGERVPLPFINPTFEFYIPNDGSLPMDGTIPSLINHRDEPTSMLEIPDMGCRLISLTIEHPHPTTLDELYRDLSLDLSPMIVLGPKVRYKAQIETPTGLRILT